MPAVRLKRAGLAMRELRLAVGKSAVEVEKESVLRWHEEGRVGNHQISRLENGLLEKPTAELLSKLAVLYGVSMETVLHAYEYPYIEEKERKNQAIERAERLLPKLPPHLRRRVSGEIERVLNAAMDDMAEDVTRPRWRVAHQESRDAVLAVQ